MCDCYYDKLERVQFHNLTHFVDGEVSSTIMMFVRVFTHNLTVYDNVPAFNQEKYLQLMASNNFVYKSCLKPRLLSEKQLMKNR